jgi:hypothetical protein
MRRLLVLATKVEHRLQVPRSSCFELCSAAAVPVPVVFDQIPQIRVALNDGTVKGKTESCPKYFQHSFLWVSVSIH